MLRSMTAAIPANSCMLIKSTARTALDFPVAPFPAGMLPEFAVSSQPAGEGIAPVYSEALQSRRVIADRQKRIS